MTAILFFSTCMTTKFEQSAATMKAFKVVIPLQTADFEVFSDESCRPAEAVETAGDDYIVELNQGWRETRPPKPKAEKLPVK